MKFIRPRKEIVSIDNQKYSILPPCLIIKNVKWSYKEAIGAFGGLISDKEKSKISKMMKKYPPINAKALLLEGHFDF